MKWYVQVLQKYAVFDGRARRKEYWMFFLFNFLVVFVLAMLEGMVGDASTTGRSVLATVYQLGMWFRRSPSASVGCTTRITVDGGCSFPSSTLYSP